MSGPDVMFGFRKGPRWEVVPELGWATSEVKNGATHLQNDGMEKKPR